MPYSVVENKGFKNMLERFNPSYRVKSRGFYADTDIPKMCTEMKMELRVLLRSAQFLSLTLDEWSDLKPGAQLLSVTVHWLTEDFRRCSTILGAAEFTEAHTSLNIATK